MTRRTAGVHGYTSRSASPYLLPMLDNLIGQPPGQFGQMVKPPLERGEPLALRP